MSKQNKVEVQKGPIESNPMTSKQMTFAQKVQEAREQAALRRHGQHTDLQEPKTRRK